MPVKERWELIGGRKVRRISRYRPRGRWYRHVGVTMVEDHFGKLYKRFPKPVQVGSAVQPNLVYVFNPARALDEDGSQKEFIRVLRAVEVSEVRATMGTRNKLAEGHWYEVLAD